MEEAPSACSSLNGSHSFPSPSLFRTPSSASSHPFGTPLQLVISRSCHRRRSERPAASNKEPEREPAVETLFSLVSPADPEIVGGGATEPSLLLSVSVRESDQPASRSPPASSESGRCSLCFVSPFCLVRRCYDPRTSCVFSRPLLVNVFELSVEPARASVDDRWRAVIDDFDVDKRAPWAITRRQPR
jgi:hypothetical protein